MHAGRGSDCGHRRPDERRTPDGLKGPSSWREPRHWSESTGVGTRGVVDPGTSVTL